MWFTLQGCEALTRLEVQLSACRCHTDSAMLSSRWLQLGIAFGVSGSLLAAFMVRLAAHEGCPRSPYEMFVESRSPANTALDFSIRLRASSSFPEARRLSRLRASCKCLTFLSSPPDEAIISRVREVTFRVRLDTSELPQGVVPGIEWEDSRLGLQFIPLPWASHEARP